MYWRGEVCVSIICGYKRIIVNGIRIKIDYGVLNIMYYYYM